MSTENQERDAKLCKIKVLMRQTIRAAKEAIEECEKSNPDMILISDIYEELDDYTSKVGEVFSHSIGIGTSITQGDRT